jgi:hypothetical protein
MTIIDVSAITTGGDGLSDRYDYSRLPEEIRIQAMTGEGTIVQGARAAAQWVREAGQVLMWAKEALPHGEYLPWVRQACGLSPTYASRLVKTAQFANDEHVHHLQGVDTATLFLLSADATTEDVREWFMERAAAGAPPSRAEVAERKRQASGRAPAPRPIELQALALWRKDQLNDAEAALVLARSITTVTDPQVREEVGLRELPKGKVLQGLAADFHRRPDGIGWDRIPHAGRIELAAVKEDESAVTEPMSPYGGEVLSLNAAATRLGIKPGTLRLYICPSKSHSGEVIRNGWRVTRAGRGLFNVEHHP